MKKFLLAFCLIIFASVNVFADDDGLLAFPGAEGFGRYATGGRGGTIYHVTNLNDSGSGSLRDAVSSSNRIIVFDVSGIIKLKSALTVKGNNTILGQTAPGEGIQVYGDRTTFSGASNLIVRYMRFHMGVEGTSGADACGVANGTNMIFDHLSVLWGRDETFSVNSDGKGDLGNITIQNSIIGQGLQNHSAGGLIQCDGGVTLYRNLYIENSTRNPKVKGLNQYVNNVVYNWGDGGCYIMGDTTGDSWADIENNYFMNGPWNNAAKPFIRGTPTFRYWGPNNYYDNDKDGTVSGYLLSQDETSGAQSDGKCSTWIEGLDALNADIESWNAVNPVDSARQTIPQISNILTAEEALYWILDSVGPVLPARDEVDQYLIDELSSFGTSGTKNGITTEKTLSHKGTGTLSGGVKPLDTDGDGIPDEWEIANGLNPNDASDAAAIAANGYANIENYSFSIVKAYPYIKVPKDLSVEQGINSLTLSWDLNGNTTDGFIIEISLDGTTYTEVTRVPAGTTSYEITDLEKDTEYWVRIHAYNDEEGIVSDDAEIETSTIDEATVPKVSQNPTPEDGETVGIAGGITFKWENTTREFGGDITYTLYLGTDASSLTEMASGITTTEYYIETLESNVTYYWRVDATNDLGTTEGTPWSFETKAGGNLFTANFYTLPEEWYAKYGEITSNTNLFNGANARMTFGDMVIGSGSNTIRVVAMYEPNNGEDTSGNYGPYSDSDAGASQRCVQFTTEADGGYLITPEVQGPCEVVLYLGNTDSNSKSVKLSTIIGSTTTEVSDLTMKGGKYTFKFTYNYEGTDKVAFRIDNNAKKFNINDIIIDSTQSTGISSTTVDNNPAKFSVNGNTVTVTNVQPGSPIIAYDMVGRVERSITATDGSATMTLPSGFHVIAAPGSAIKVIF